MVTHFCYRNETPLLLPLCLSVLRSQSSWQMNLTTNWARKKRLFWTHRCGLESSYRKTGNFPLAKMCWLPSPAHTASTPISRFCRSW